MPTRLFIVVPSGQMNVSTRVYNSASCDQSGVGYHDARIFQGVQDVIVADPDRNTIKAPPIKQFRDPTAWPSACACGFAFGPIDGQAINRSRGSDSIQPQGGDGTCWQVSIDELYRRADNMTGMVGVLADFGAGATFRAPWLGDGYQGPDGVAWIVVLPPGRGITDAWPLYGPSGQGDRWTVTGIPPVLTATPSIQTADYHGWLTDGWLSDG